MEMHPCKDDVGAIIGVYIVVALCEIGLLLVSEFESFFCHHDFASKCSIRYCTNTGFILFISNNHN